MKFVYTLYHLYELENACDEVKFLGVFSSKKKPKKPKIITQTLMDLENTLKCFT